MHTLVRSSLLPGLILVGLFAACSDPERRRRSDDDDEAGQAGMDSAGTGGGGRTAGAGGSKSDAGSAGRATGGTSGSVGETSGGSGGLSSGGSANGGDAGADGAGTGAEGGESDGEGGAPGTGGSSGAGAGSGGTSAGAGGSSGTGGTGGTSGTGGCGVSIEPLNHHLGDGDGSEGTSFTRTFSLGCDCTNPWLSFQIDGPNREDPPLVSLNGIGLASLSSFFPAVSSDDVWQSNGGGSYDYNGYLQIHYSVSDLTVAGTNTFTITNGTAADDYYFQDVRLECGAATTPPGPDIVNRTSWVGYYDDRSGDNPLGIQGAFYAYSDGVSCTVPSSVCATGACCLSGTTLATSPTTNWGCGMGLQLESSGGTSPIESPYSGPADCFELEFTGDSGGSDLRVQAASHLDMSGRTAPAVVLGPVSGTTVRQICFSDFTCPTDAPNPCAVTGSWYRLEANIVGGYHAGAFNVCLRSLIPYAN